MKKSLLLITFIVATAAITFGQEYFRPAVSTTIPNSLRYEIVQTVGTNLNVTLRLDKYTGRVFLLSTCPQRNIIGIVPCWKETTVLELPKPAVDSTVKFQIFAQGEHNQRYILMINNISGQTWHLGIEDGIYKWTPFTDTVTLPQSFEIVR
ncbi:MAG: hypothetical protein ABL999_03370 [Pyrinomonadaceae bacterium]